MPVDATKNPIIITSPTLGLVYAGNAWVESVRFVGGAAGDTVQLSDGSYAHLIMIPPAASTNYVEEAHLDILFRGQITGALVSSAGILYIYLKEGEAV